MLPRILPFAATVPSGPLPYVMSWVYVCPLASRIDHWARVEALCVLPDVLCSVTLTTRKMFPALGWSNSLPVLFFTELSVTVQSALTTTGLPIAFPAGAVVGAGVFPVAGVFVAPWLAARMPTQPSTASANTPRTTHSQVRRFFGGGPGGYKGVPGGYGG